MAYSGGGRAGRRLAALLMQFSFIPGIPHHVLCRAKDIKEAIRNRREIHPVYQVGEARFDPIVFLFFTRSIITTALLLSYHDYRSNISAQNDHDSRIDVVQHLVNVCRVVGRMPEKTARFYIAALIIFFLYQQDIVTIRNLFQIDWNCATSEQIRSFIS